ncbi:MAG: glycoside hydrolase family 2 TIM barrel-domain containing protein, partial [Bacteroidota bacterium]|nr:glycoside hydrolase family 2 TIM barrel-domain containing protein [Bacteroidota bacterium]
MKTILQLLACYLALWGQSLQAQNKTELNQGWKCSPVSAIKENGTDISVPSYSLEKWMPATVPGTVLTTLLNNKKVPDPFYGMNNKNIPDIYQTGREHYTYWFAKDFNENSPATGQQIWLHFRGVNYGCDIYLNGHKLNSQTHYGMFLRQTYNITTFLRKDGHNRLAVLVWPPDPVGNPNGGQGGDGTIARNNTHQYVAGWDWIQPIRDRNTGIWDKVTLQKTLAVKIKDPHVITLVHGIRNPIGPQDPVLIKVSATLENPTSSTVDGILQYTLADQKISKKVRLSPHSNLWINFDDLTLKSPKLWWPNGYGPQNLYPLQLKFLINGTIVSDAENVTVGIREIQATTNPETHSKQIAVNGQKIFIKGGNWIISDAMLRLSDERYDAEVRFHRDMNLNLIRVWGGALIERPEFYAACDKYGLLVFQDFGFSGDCNGRWTDPKKLEDQWTRRAYPGDHALFLESASDQIKMIRNHPSLAIWCGGNEIAPPADILHALKDSILPKLDGTRWFVNYSNADDMSLNTIGDNGDGPYGVQQINTFWGHRTWPFNSEIGSVGVGDYESLTRFMPKENLIAPEFSPETGHKVDSVWQYHRYIGYDASIAPYGNVKDIKDFCMKA